MPVFYYNSTATLRGMLIYRFLNYRTKGLSAYSVSTAPKLKQRSQASI